MRDQHCKVVRMGSESSFQVGRHGMSQNDGSPFQIGAIKKIQSETLKKFVAVSFACNEEC